MTSCTSGSPEAGAAHVSDAGMSQRDHPVLALLECPEDAGLRGWPGGRRAGRRRPVPRLGLRAADRHRDQYGHAEPARSGRPRRPLHAPRRQPSPDPGNATPGRTTSSTTGAARGSSAQVGGDGQTRAPGGVRSRTPAPDVQIVGNRLRRSAGSKPVAEARASAGRPEPGRRRRAPPAEACSERASVRADQPRTRRRTREVGCADTTRGGLSLRRLTVARRRGRRPGVRGARAACRWPNAAIGTPSDRFAPRAAKPPDGGASAVVLRSLCGPRTPRPWPRRRRSGPTPEPPSCFGPSCAWFVIRFARRASPCPRPRSSTPRAAARARRQRGPASRPSALATTLVKRAEDGRPSTRSSTCISRSAMRRATVPSAGKGPERLVRPRHGDQDQSRPARWTARAMTADPRRCWRRSSRPSDVATRMRCATWPSMAVERVRRDGRPARRVRTLLPVSRAAALELSQLMARALAADAPTPDPEGSTNGRLRLTELAERIEAFKRLLADQVREPHRRAARGRRRPAAIEPPRHRGDRLPWRVARQLAAMREAIRPLARALATRMARRRRRRVEAGWTSGAPCAVRSVGRRPARPGFRRPRSRAPTCICCATCPARWPSSRRSP